MALRGIGGFAGWYPFELTWAVLDFAEAAEPTAGEARELAVALFAPPATAALPMVVGMAAVKCRQGSFSGDGCRWGGWVI